MNNILNYLSNQAYKAFTISTLSIFIIATIKVFSKKDNNFKYTTNDLSIGVNLIVNAIVFLLNSILDILLQYKHNTTIAIDMVWIIVHKFFLIFVCLLLIVVVVMIVRKYGWKPEKDMELRPLPGVIFPIVVGVLAIIISLKN